MQYTYYAVLYVLYFIQYKKYCVMGSGRFQTVLIPVTYYKFCASQSYRPMIYTLQDVNKIDIFFSFVFFYSLFVLGNIFISDVSACISLVS